MAGEFERGVPSFVTADLSAGAGAGELTAEEVRERMSGNLCRCGAYNGIMEAICETFRKAADEDGRREAA
jgi:xanthine dehydrogenase YagT iron-sulfur-binding subunit